MYNKVLQTNKLEENSVFLFGARQTGKPMLPIAYVNQIIL